MDQFEESQNLDNTVLAISAFMFLSNMFYALYWVEIDVEYCILVLTYCLHGNTLMGAAGS